LNVIKNKNKVDVIQFNDLMEASSFFHYDFGFKLREES